VITDSLPRKSLPRRDNAKYYEVHFEDDLKGTDEEGQLLGFRIAKAAPQPVPEAATSFANEAIELVDHIRLLIKTDEGKQRLYVHQIGQFSRIGLEDGDLVTAVSSREEFKKRFVFVEGPILREAYIKSITKSGTLLGTLCGLLAIVLTMFPSLILSRISFENASEEANFAFLIHKAGTMSYVLFGVTLGVIASAIVRNRTLAFDSLNYFDIYRLATGFRYFYVSVLASILALLLYSGWLVVGITDKLLLNSFTNKFSIAIIVGLVTGFSEPNITNLISGAFSATKNLAGSSGP